MNSTQNIVYMNLIIYSVEMWKMDLHYKAHAPFLKGRNPYYKFTSEMEVLYTFCNILSI